jgi:hypothetical protein
LFICFLFTPDIKFTCIRVRISWSESLNLRYTSILQSQCKTGKLFILVFIISACYFIISFSLLDVISVLETYKQISSRPETWTWQQNVNNSGKRVERTWRWLSGQKKKELKPWHHKFSISMGTVIKTILRIINYVILCAYTIQKIVLSCVPPKFTFWLHSHMFLTPHSYRFHRPYGT